MNINRCIKNAASGTMVVFSLSQLTDENNFPLQPIRDLPAQDVPLNRYSVTQFAPSSVSGASDTTFLNFSGPTGPTGFPNN